MDPQHNFTNPIRSSFLNRSIYPCLPGFLSASLEQMVLCPSR